MKKVPVTAIVDSLVDLLQADGTYPVRGAKKRVVTHRLTLLKDPSIEKAIKIAESVERHAEEDGTMKVVTFCTKRDDGKYSLDLTPQQAKLLTKGKMSVDDLCFDIEGATFRGVVEIREIGDPVIDRRTKEQLPDIDQAHASMSQLECTLPTATTDQIRISKAVANALARMQAQRTATVAPKIVTKTTEGDPEPEPEPEGDEGFNAEGEVVTKKPTRTKASGARVETKKIN